MLSLIIAESSLELIPKNLQDHPAILSHAKKLGKNPNEILLDNSWHFAAMKGIENEIKRGRPDLVHFCLLEACTIPLYQQNKIKIYLHTIQDEVISLGTQVNIPKSYHRFEGLIEKLYKINSINSDGKILLELKSMTFLELMEKIKPKQVIGLSTDGKSSSIPKVAQKLDENTCLVVGGFQKGHFSKNIQNRIDQLFSVDKKSLEAHVVIGRILYEYEKTIFM